jgi:hypothetical protein
VPLLVPPDGVCRVAVQTVDVDADCVNVFHLLVTPTPAADADGIALLGAIVSRLADQIYVRMSNGLDIVQADMRISDGTTTVDVSGGFSSLGGNHDGTPVGANCAAVISWHGVWDYRGGKPRNYIPGLTSDQLYSPQKLDASFAASLAGGAVQVIADLAAIPVEIPAWTTVTLGALLGNTAVSAGTFAPYGGASVRRPIGTQRGRIRN